MTSKTIRAAIRRNPNSPLPGWLIADLLAAERDDIRAKWAMRRSERATDALIEAGVEDREAYDRCGVELADCRSIRTYHRLYELKMLAVKIRSYRQNGDNKQA